jgi:hypothetical protein
MPDCDVADTQGRFRYLVLRLRKTLPSVVLDIEDRVGFSRQSETVAFGPRGGCSRVL